MNGLAPAPELLAAARRRHLARATPDDLALLDRAGWRVLVGGRNNAVYAVEHQGRTY